MSLSGRNRKGRQGGHATNDARVHGDVRPRRNYGRWRALCLSLVYVVFAVHILHWKLTGHTLAPLELNEVMYTLELGIITAGFLFMCFLVLGTLVFGRFFCSWACHIMVLQDLSAWVLRTLGIRAKPVRSRLLLWVPALTAVYMFVWPQVLRAWHSQSLPTFRFATDREGWASFATNNFWRNLPGPGVIALTFVVCGFLIIYVLGSRTFCTYVCPYGAIFALADRFSPGRIRVSDKCKQCGTCTAACTMGVRVHDEIRQHGMIVNPACLKDLDCVGACPQQALRYKFSRPAFFKSLASGGRFGRVPYDFTWTEELVAAGVFVLVLLSFRSLYSRIPFLLSLAMGVVIGYLTILAVRLASRPNVKLSSIALKSLGRWRPAGYAYAATVCVIGLLVAHSAFVRYHEYHGLRGATALTVSRAAARTDDPRAASLGSSGGAAAADDTRALAATADGHLRMADRWGLIANERVERDLVTTSLLLDRPDEAAEYARRFLLRHPGHIEVRLKLAQALLGQEKTEAARRELFSIVAPYAQEREAPAAVVAAHQALAALCAREGQYSAAAREYERALTLAPDRAELHAEFGGMLAELGRIDTAIRALEAAVRLDDSLAQAHYNLGTLLGHQGRFLEAIPHYQRALAAMSDDADVHNNLGFALLRSGRPDDAREQFEAALAIDPQQPDAHFNLGVILANGGRHNEAEQHLRRAADLDPRYAELLRGHR